MRIGLVLSGGGLRGAGHVGVLQQLVAHGIPIDVIVGSSAGAIGAAYYAAVGLTLEELIAALKSDEPPLRDRRGVVVLPFRRSLRQLDLLARDLLVANLVEHVRDGVETCGPLVVGANDDPVPAFRARPDERGPVRQLCVEGLCCSPAIDIDGIAWISSKAVGFGAGPRRGGPPARQHL